MVLSVMLSSCETALTESTLFDSDKTVSAGLDNTVSNKLRIKVTEELAQKLLSVKDSEGVIPAEVAAEAGLGPETGVSKVSTLFMIGGKYESRQKAAGLHLWYEIELDPDHVATKASSDLKGIQGLSVIEPVARIRMASVMNDPKLSLQWHYHNTGAYSFKEGFDMGLEEVWRRYQVYGSPEVIVAICDNGFDVSHPDLIDNLWVNEAEYNGTEGVDDDMNGYIDDIHGYNFSKKSSKFTVEDHGTHVAGTVGAVNNNGIGVCGVAGGKWPEKGTRLMLLETLKGDEQSYLKAMQYAVENGALISQNSWGYEAGVKILYESDKAGIDYFIDNAGLDENGNQTGLMKGGLMVFASGNDTQDFGYPGQYERCMAVSAVGPTGLVAPYSNYGDWVDVSAPGGDRGLSFQFGGVYSTLPGEQYGGLQGTSMAAPHVSGLAALILSVAGGEGYTADQLYADILNSTDPTFYNYNPGKEGLYGAGVIDAVRAVSQFSKIAPSAHEHVEVSLQSNNAAFTLDVPKDEDDSTAFYYNIYISDKEINVADAQKYTFEIEKSDVLENGLHKVIVNRLGFEQTYHYAVSASDYAGNESVLSHHGTFSTEKNNMPVLEVSEDTKIEINSYDTATRTFKYSDPDNHSVTIEFSTTAERGITFTEVSEGLAVVKIEGSESDKGDFEFTISVTDEFGLANTATYQYTILDNSAPELVSRIADVTLAEIGSTYEISVSKHFNDPDGESLSLKFDVADKKVATASANKGNIVVKAVGAGSTTIKATASDASGESVSTEFNVVVFDMSEPFLIYPNPVTDILNIRGKESAESSVRILSSTGHQVYEGRQKTGLESVVSIDMTANAPGVYTVIINPEGGEGYTRTIVKL